MRTANSVPSQTSFSDATKASASTVLEMDLDQLHTTPSREWMALLPVGIVVLNSGGLVEDANPAAIELLGIPLLRESWRDVIKRAFAPRSDDGCEVSLKDGRRLKIATRALSDGNGQIITLSDVTDSREIQQRLAQQERLASMGRLVASLAHQLRTPIASALLYAHQMHDKHHEQSALKLIDRLSFMERQIADMLLMAGGGEAVVERVSCQSLVNVIQEQFEPILREKNIVLQVEHLAGRCAVLGNPDALLGAIGNLIDNAIQACQNDPKSTHEITLYTKRLNGKLLIDVRDNGVGMDEKTCRRAIEPFFTTKTKGTGLGLAVVHAVMHSHKGELRVQSVAGEGSTFTLVLPLIKSSSSPRFELSSSEGVLLQKSMNTGVAA